MRAGMRARERAQEFIRVEVPLLSVRIFFAPQQVYLCWSEEDSDKVAISAWAGHLAGGIGSKDE